MMTKTMKMTLTMMMIIMMIQWAEDDHQGRRIQQVDFDDGDKSDDDDSTSIG